MNVATAVVDVPPSFPGGLEARGTPGNRTKLAAIEVALAEILQDVLKRGFFGRATLEIVVQDGTIQQVRRTVERIER